MQNFMQNFIQNNKFKFLFFSSLSVLAVNSNAADDSSLTAYGSLRLQAEQVSVDQPIAGRDDSYTAFQDAYSRVGIKGHTTVGNGITLSGKVEIPLNVPKFQVDDPSFFEGFYKHNQGPRIYKITASSSDFGSLSFGKQWLAYYNNVAYPVDYFSSFYSGFATHATFRREALTYTSPVFSGFSGTVSAVDLTDDNGTSYLDTAQYAASYSNGGYTVAIAYQDTHDNRANLLGGSASYTIGPWRFATKVEKLYSNNTVIQNKDPLIINIYGSYAMDKFTFKAMYVSGDGKAGANDEADAFFIGDSYHLGVDYQYSKQLKFFAEYFYEENSYAIYEPHAESFAPYAGYQAKSDGQALIMGARFDF